MLLKIYVDLLSQPSRALLIFARANNIQYEEKMVSIAKQEHKKPEMLAINPMGLLPAMTDDNLKLFESHAIFRYLATTRSVPDHWYPADPQKRAKVDCILDWHHLNLRLGSSKVSPTRCWTLVVCGTCLDVDVSSMFGNFGKVLIMGAVQFLRQKVFGPRLGLQPDERVVDQSRLTLSTSLKFIEDNWLTEEGPFLVGALQPSIADLSLSCEVLQSELLDRLDREAIFGPREKIQRWVQAVEEALAPHFGDVHSLLRMVGSKGQARRDAQKRSAL